MLKLALWRLLVLSMLMAACQPQPTQRFALGEVLLQQDFDQSFAWENYSDPDQQVNFRVENGVYRAQASNGGFTWTLNAQAHTNVVMQVDTEQLSEYANNAYGLMCRAAPTNNGDGYYFLISGDGHYTLRRGATDEVNALIPWTYNDAIHRGQTINRMRIVCIDDYLGLYVNGSFVGETRDTYFSRGYAGITAAVPEDGAVDVTFDRLTIWEGELIEE